MAVHFDVRSHQFYELDEPPRARTAERVPLSAKESAQFKKRGLHAEPDNGTRGYTVGSVLLGPPGPPRK